MKNALLPFLLILFLFSCAYADIYQYVDENGVVCYTDLPLGKKANRVLKEKSKLTSVKQQAVRRVPKKTSTYQSIIHEKATKYNIDPHLVRAIIKTESNWNERAISRKGAMGLMQLMPATASEMKVYDPFNPEENIEGGTKYLRYLLELFNGDLTLALAAYNAGPKAIERFGVTPPFPETIQYVNKVLSFYNGTLTHPLSEGSTIREERPEPIYKITLKDGTVLYTNSTFLLKNPIKF